MGFLFEGDAVSATPAGKYIWHVRRHQMSIGRITVPRITEEIFDTKFYEQPLSKRSLTCWGFLRHIHGRPWAVLRCRTAEPPWGWFLSFFANHFHLLTWCAMSTIRCRTTSGRGRPLTNTPPSWLTPPWPEGKDDVSGIKLRRRIFQIRWQSTSGWIFLEVLSCESTLPLLVYVATVRYGCQQDWLLDLGGSGPTWYNMISGPMWYRGLYLWRTADLAADQIRPTITIMSHFSAPPLRFLMQSDFC